MFDSLTDVELFQLTTDSFNHYNARCPRCGATGKLSPYGNYSRWLVFLDDNASYQRVMPHRFKCSSCGATHALLPDIITPYSPYSLRFKLSALIAYFRRDMSVVAVCEHYGIAVSTIYAWEALFRSHMKLMLGVLAASKEPALAFLRSLFCSAGISERLRGFYDRHGFSFMQNRSTTATRPRPP